LTWLSLPRIIGQSNLSLNMDNFLLPVILVLLAGFFQGTFGLGMRSVKPLAWEAWWLVYGFVALIAIPVAWALVPVAFSTLVTSSCGLPSCCWAWP
jgi:hypothetical protein